MRCETCKHFRAEYQDENFGQCWRIGSAEPFADPAALRVRAHDDSGLESVFVVRLDFGCVMHTPKLAEDDDET